MKTKIFVALSVLLVLALVAPTALAAGNARRPAIVAGADNVVALQRTDSGWEGTWYWYVGSTGNATNLTGVTALGLLEAYRDTKDQAYLDAAIAAAGFIQTHLGAGATGTQHHVRTTAPDVVFLQCLSEVTGDSSYATRANLEWNNLTSFWPTAGDLDSLFRAIPRRSAWDIAFFLEAAYLSGDATWADQAAAILANTSDTFYYGTDTWWYALNVAGAVRALVGCGYAGAYPDEVVYLLEALIGLVDDENGVSGYAQDTAYAVLAFNTVGGAARRYANDLGRWLASKQEVSGGWMEAGNEYPEVDGEAVRALACTIGTNVTLDGFEPGLAMNSSWTKSETAQKAIPFSGFDEFGYNYQARVFVGVADGVDRNLDGMVWGDPTYANDHLVMKWSKAWDNARFHGGDWGPDAWETNEWNGMVSGGSGEVWHYKIIWVGEENSPYWRDGGYLIWGQFEVIMSQGVAGGEHIWETLVTPNGFGGP